MTSAGFASRYLPYILSRVRRPHPSGDLRAAFALDHGDIVLPLQVQPKLRAIAEISAEADSWIGGDLASAIQNIRDAPRWHADVERQPIGAQFPRSQLALQQTARVYGRRHSVLSLVIVDDLDLVSVALAKLETDAPTCIHGHRPLIFPPAFQLMQADTLERTEVVERLGDI